MKILFVDLGRAGKLFSTGRMFEEKLHESSLNDVEVTPADVAEFESPGGRRLEADGKKLALRGADVIIVMEKWQKELLTRFMDYKNWGKIHLFGDICKLGKPEGVPSCDVDFVYRSDNEKMSDVCTLLIEKLKKFFKGDDGAVSGLAST